MVILTVPLVVNSVAAFAWLPNTAEYADVPICIVPPVDDSTPILTSPPVLLTLTCVELVPPLPLFKNIPELKVLVTLLVKVAAPVEAMVKAVVNEDAPLTLTFKLWLTSK